MVRYISLLLFIGLSWGHNGKHPFLTPYISPGIQIGLNQNKTLFMSCQLTLGTSFKITNEKHFEDTFPFFLGRTFGVRRYYQKEKPVVTYKYYYKENVGLNNYLKSKILFKYYKIDINKITERAVIEKINKYGSALIIAKFRNISAVSFTFGNGIFSGTSTLRNSHRGPQPSFT